MKLAGIEVGGLSVGGVNTCIDLPGFGLCFDIGRTPEFSIARRTVLFTHAHVDHMGGVVAHCATRALRAMPPPRYVVPHESVEAFAELFEVWRRLDGSTLPHEVVPLGVGEEHSLRPDLVAVPFRSPHRAPCQGYVLHASKKKLKDEHAGKGSDELRELRASGVELEHELREPLVAFSGDSTIAIVDREEAVRTARLLILECTFLDERVSVDEAQRRGHVHLDQIAERADLFENEAVLLTHFSARYKAEEVEALLDRRLPSGLRARTHALLGAGA